MYTGAASVNVGPTDLEHTRDDGYQYAIAVKLNEAGHVLGNASRYNGTATYLGTSAWLYDGASSINIGLTGVEHTRNDGFQSNTSSFLNESGLAVGYAKRYNSTASDLGQSAWLFNGSTTVNIGLTGSDYTRGDNGYQYSQATLFNQTGQVAGTSRRYGSTGQSLGQSAWLYDLTLDQTFGLNLSVRSDGYAYSSVNYLGEDGLMLGSYRLYDTDDTLIGVRAFAFSVDDGAFDLGSLVEGGLDAAGWALLSDAIEGNNPGQILGVGTLNDGMTGSISYLLTPVSAVPLPATVWLFASGLLVLVRAGYQQSLSR
jgi:hypothetical protein